MAELGYNKLKGGGVGHDEDDDDDDNAQEGGRVNPPSRPGEFSFPLSLRIYKLRTFRSQPITT